MLTILLVISFGTIDLYYNILYIYNNTKKRSNIFRVHKQNSLIISHDIRNVFTFNSKWLNSLIIFRLKQKNMFDLD